MSAAPFDNRLRRALRPLARLPRWVARPLRDRAIGRAIPFVGTAGLALESLDDAGAVLRLPDRRRVHNHIGGAHAAATALLAETATGLALGWHLPDDAVPLLVRLDVHYVRRAQGALRATARLDGGAVATLRSAPRGELDVPVEVVDAAGERPVECTLRWAWVPRRREPAAPAA
ncbi:MAG TPA: DUF4442 domain-containing protein [Xanthomonadales bacterium]|nr:DUF4442 domain-containing protein [Xanthomonadales bacterium]